MHSSKEINVFPFSLFVSCYEVCLHFLPLQAKHFRQEHLMCHDSNICETAYPFSSHQKIPLPGCFCWFWEEFLRQKEFVPNLLPDISEMFLLQKGLCFVLLLVFYSCSLWYILSCKGNLYIPHIDKWFFHWHIRF